MTLPVSSIVNVSITISPTAPPKKGFGVAAFVSTENLLAGGQPSNRVTFYSSIAEVGTEWATTSETYLAALAYFGQSPSPVKFGVIVQSTEPDTTGTMIGANSAESVIGTWNAITDGSFNITLGTNSSDIIGLDFSAAADMDAVAATIQTFVQADSAEWVATTVIWSVDHFEFDNNIIGGNITATSQALSGTDISIGLMQTDVTIVGSDPTTVIVLIGTQTETTVEALTQAEQASSDWYGVLTMRAVRDAQEQLDVAAWTEARVKIYSTVVNNPNALILNDIDNNAYRLFNSNYTRTCCTYSSAEAEFIDAAVLGKAFTVNFNAPDSVITLKFKPLAGVSTENLSTSQKGALDDKRANALISIAETSMYAESYMSSQLFFDERHGIDWLTGEIESNLFAYLISRPTKVPLTDAGGASLEQQVIRALDAGFSNGLLGTGETSGGKFLGQGYETIVQKVADMAPADKANRISPTIAFTALLAGAIHFVEISGIVER